MLSPFSEENLRRLEKQVLSRVSGIDRVLIAPAGYGELSVKLSVHEAGVWHHQQFHIDKADVDMNLLGTSRMMSSHFGFCVRNASDALMKKVYPPAVKAITEDRDRDRADALKALIEVERAMNAEKALRKPLDDHMTKMMAEKERLLIEGKKSLAKTKEPDGKLSETWATLVEDVKRAKLAAEKGKAEAMTLNEEFDEIVSMIARVNEAVSTTIEHEACIDCEARALGSYGSSPVYCGDVYFFKRLLYSKQAKRLVVDMMLEDDETFAFDLATVEDCFPDLEGCILAAAQPESGFNFERLTEITYKVNRFLSRHPAAIADKLSEATYATVHKATEKAAVKAAETRENFYQRRPLYGLI